MCDKDIYFWKELRFRLYDIDPRLRWPAIETVAKLMRRWWQLNQQEKVRRFIRALFWSINDESGGIGWSSAQTIAETIMLIPEIIDPYGSMMIASTMDEPPLVKGGLWGIGRLGKSIAESVEFFQERILATFQTDDPETLGLVSWAMGEAGFKPALPYLEKLSERKEPVQIYINGDFKEKPLGRWAEEAMQKISQQS